MTTWPTRIRVVGGPWPERIGCVGHVVPPQRKEYPWVGLGRAEVVIKLDSDPLGHSLDDWTCVLGQKDIEIVEAARG